MRQLSETEKDKDRYTSEQIHDTQTQSETGTDRDGHRAEQIHGQQIDTVRDSQKQ